MNFRFFPPAGGKGFFGDSSWCREYLDKISAFWSFFWGFDKF